MESVWDALGNVKNVLMLTILGTQHDKYLSVMNNFMKHLGNFRLVLEEEGFPFLPLALLYTPFLYIVVFLNTLRLSFAIWVTVFVIILFFLVIVGLVFSLVFICCKSVSHYLAKVNTPDDEEFE